MVQFAKLMAFSVVVVLITTTPAAAQTSGGGVVIPGAIGAGLVAIGGGYGIGRLAGFALESMARQPEIAGSIQTAMIISAALIEGFVFFGLYICMNQNPWAAAAGG